MTENEAKEILEEVKMLDDSMYQYNPSYSESLDIAIKALQEIQQYRSIGTVEECREAMERQRAKEYKILKPCKSVNYYQCPVCDGLLHINENYCGNCGQAISWKESED